MIKNYLQLIFLNWVTTMHKANIHAITVNNGIPFSIPIKDVIKGTAKTVHPKPVMASNTWVINIIIPDNMVVIIFYLLTFCTCPLEILL